MRLSLGRMAPQRQAKQSCSRRTEQLVELVKDAEIMLKDGRHLSGQTITIFLNDADNIDRDHRCRERNHHPGKWKHRHF